MKRRRKTTGCACGSGIAYAICCGRFLSGEELPERAQDLMRSRYTAYAKGDVNYIIATTDPEGSQWSDDETQWRKSVRDFHRSCTFHGVEVLDATEEGDRATVRFHAGLSKGLRAEDASFIETSSFVRRDGKWLYSGAEIEPTG